MLALAVPSLAVALVTAAGTVPQESRAASAEPVQYTLELLEPETPLVGIHVATPGDADGASEFSLSEGWAGLAETGADLELVEARGARDTLASERLTAHRWRVRHEPRETLTLTFELRPTRHRANAGPPGYYLPILEPRLLHALGAQTLPAPEHLDGREERAIGLAWRGFEEEGWHTISSFGATRELTITAALDDFRHALFLAGDVRRYERQLAGGSLWLALFGSWSFGDEELVALAERIVALEREFFGGAGRPYYLISLIPVGGGLGSSSWGGTGLTDSFALFMTADNGLGLDESGGGVPWLLAHEHFHEWNGHVIRLAQPEQPSYWFSEGFTDFFTRRLLARAGLLTPEQELASWNRRLAAYSANPERHAPASRVQEAFWTVREVGELPYQRGDLIALLADHEIHARSEGERTLDDVMRTLVARAAAGAGPFTSLELLSAIGELAGPEAESALRAWALDGVEPVFPPDLGAPGLRLVPSEVPTFDTGFDHEASLRDGVVSGVRNGGPAQRAGLRDGMLLSGWSVTMGQVDRPLAISVREGTLSRTLTYLPHGVARPGWRLERASGEAGCH